MKLYTEQSIYDARIVQVYFGLKPSGRCLPIKSQPDQGISWLSFLDMVPIHRWDISDKLVAWILKRFPKSWMGTANLNLIKASSTPSWICWNYFRKTFNKVSNIACDGRPCTSFVASSISRIALVYGVINLHAYFLKMQTLLEGTYICYSWVYLYITKQHS